MHLPPVNKVAIPLDKSVINHAVNGPGQGRAVSGAKCGDLSHRRLVQPLQGSQHLPLTQRQARPGQFTPQCVLTLSDQMVEKEEQVAGRQGLEHA